MTKSEKLGTGLAEGRLGLGLGGVAASKLAEGTANPQTERREGNWGGGEFSSEYRAHDGALGDPHEVVSWAQRGETARARTHGWYVVDQGSGLVF